MKKIQILSIILLILLSFISTAQKPIHVKTNYYEGYIFYNDPRFPLKASSHFFIPTSNEIEKMENKISKSIWKLISDYEKEHIYDHCNIQNNLSTYKRHYIGYVDNGEKIISIYFFNDVPENWDKGIFMIYDGGCSYFQMRYYMKNDSLNLSGIGFFP